MKPYCGGMNTSDTVTTEKFLSKENQQPPSSQSLDSELLCFAKYCQSAVSVDRLMTCSLASGSRFQSNMQKALFALSLRPCYSGIPVMLLRVRKIPGHVRPACCRSSAMSSIPCFWPLAARARPASWAWRTLVPLGGMESTWEPIKGG